MNNLREQLKSHFEHIGTLVEIWIDTGTNGSDKLTGYSLIDRGNEYVTHCFTLNDLDNKAECFWGHYHLYDPATYQQALRVARKDLYSRIFHSA